MHVKACLEIFCNFFNKLFSRHSRLFTDFPDFSRLDCNSRHFWQMWEPSVSPRVL